MTPWRWRDRRALVTGASSGIGEAFARALAARGMHLALSARREARLAALAVALRDAHGVRVDVLPADLEAPGAASDLWARASAAAPVDLLVNNAGFGARGRFDEIPLERQAAMVRLDCGAVLELAHHAFGAMRARGGGGIVNVASLAAFQPVPRLAAYAASKAFVLSLSRALWAEGRGAGVRVLALCPGRTPTEFQETAGTGEAAGTFGATTAEEVVEAALDGLERNRHTVVPGAANRLASHLSPLVPSGVLLPLVERGVERAARG